MTRPLRLLSIGAGAIGTYIGGSLALHGHQVVFVERQEVAERLRGSGLKLTLSGTGHPVQDVQIVTSLAEALDGHDFDAALFALKSFDTPRFLESVEGFKEALPPVLCLSNGVANEDALAAALGDDRVIAGTVTSAIGVRGQGDIVLEKLRGTGVAAGHSLSGRLVEAMNGAGLNCRLFPRAADMKWSKMLTNLVSNATSAILDMPAGEVFADPGLYRLEIEQLRETLRVMRAQGIQVVDLPGTPVRLLALAVTRLPLWLSRPLLARKVGGGRGAKMPSFHIDLHSGRGKSEVDYLNGAVVRAGREHQVPTPVNELLNRTLLALTAGETPLEAFRGKPAVLLKELK